MLVAGLCFALMSAVVNVAGQWFSGMELVFYRSLFAFVLILLPLFWRHRREGMGVGMDVLAGDHPGLHLRRGLIGFIALATFFYALTHLPMSMAVTLNYASPLFLALLMPWQLHERPGVLQYLAVLTGFAGMLLLLHPWDAGRQDLGAGLVGLFSGVMAAFAYVHVRRLGRLHEPEWRTLFWFAAVSLVGSGMWSWLAGWHLPPPETLPWLIALGVFATCGQWAMTRAYRTGRTVLVASFAFSTVLFSAILDTVLFKEDLSPGAWAGMAVIVVAGMWAARLGLRDTH